MGIYPQPNRWLCGPFALKHALLTLGIVASENELARVAGTDRTGTDETELARAAATFGCELPFFRHEQPEEARVALGSYLRGGIPVLLCILQWSHWVTVVKEERGQFIVLDSREPAVLRVASWSQLRELWVYREANGAAVRALYDLHPVLPRRRTRTRAKFSIQRARYLRREANRPLAQSWNEYVEDLLVLCRPATLWSEDALPFSTFVDMHGVTVLAEVDYWHGEIDRRRARRLLDHMRFVADTYGFMVQPQDEVRTIAGVTTILALWAAREFGIGDVYAPPSQRRRRR